MTNSGFTWGGQLLFRRCLEFHISGFMKTSASSVGKIFILHSLMFLLKLGFQNLKDMFASNSYLPTHHTLAYTFFFLGCT